jgi:hypothetical protein
MRYRREADRYIDRAHSAIASAEMVWMHSFTEADKTAALAQLRAAQEFLGRAIAARDAWDAAEHDEYETYPVVEAAP